MAQAEVGQRAEAWEEPHSSLIPGSQPQLPAGRASFPNMVCSPPEHTLIPSGGGGGGAGGAGRPAHLPSASDPRTWSYSDGSPQPLPVTTGSASRVSHRKTPPAKGVGCRQGHASQTPPTWRRAAGGGGPAEGLQAVLASGAGELHPGPGPAGKGDGVRVSPGPGGHPGSYWAAAPRKAQSQAV